MLLSAKHYVKFAQGKNYDDFPVNGLRNLRLLNPTGRQHLILLLAAERLPVHLFSELCDEIEKLIFCYIVSRESMKVLEVKFASWAGQIREVQNKIQLVAFIQDRLEPERRKLIPRTLSALYTLGTSRISKPRTRYLLARLADHIQGQASGKSSNDKVEEYMKKEIEHILPQSLKQPAVEEFGEGESCSIFLERLGNLTLLDFGMNESAADDPYSSKKPKYKHSDVLMTRLLGSSDDVGQNGKLSQVAATIKAYDRWDRTALEHRERALVAKATEIWGLDV